MASETAPPPYAPGVAVHACSGKLVYAQVFENERWFPFVGWGKKLLPTDRTHWSSRDGKTAEAPNPAVPAPEGCAWQADWAYSDWQYAVDFPQDFGPTKTKTSCVRQRVWFRGFLGAATPSSGKGLGGAAPGAPQHAAYSAPLRAHAAAPTAFATIDAGKLFLLMKEGATKATRVIELADVAGVEDVHELEAGMPHMFTLTLDGRANAATKGAVVQLSTESQAASQLWKSELGRASRAARGTGTGFDPKGALEVAKAGAKIGGAYMCGAFGGRIGWDVAGAITSRMGM